MMPKMINFKKVELGDKNWIDLLIAAADMPGCHHNFTNIFAWSDTFNYRVARVNNFLVVKGSINGEPYYFYPAGWGDIKPVIAAMKLDADNCGHQFTLMGVSTQNRTVLDSLFPDSFKYEAVRDSFDYVYRLDKLVTLPGNKLHAKRNHINRFKQNRIWSFEEISLDNLAECWEMNIEWCKKNIYRDHAIAYDLCAVRRCFENFLPLGLEGGLIRSNGRVIAFTMGEKLNSDTYVIHIEKAFAEIQGAYQIINQQFAAWVQRNYPQLLYINREEDMGCEGLRRAKLSYHPDKMEEKYSATYVAE